MSSKPILCLDFDGVVHSYSSGWKGARVIPDPPVPGALEFILDAQKIFDVVIFSSRSHQWGGRRAMKRWLIEHLVSKIDREFNTECMPYTALDYIEQIQAYATEIVSKIRFPLFKPAAFVTLDDRAITFNGVWPEVGTLRAFKPWNKE